MADYTKNNWFVYQAWVEDKLYACNLRYDEVEENMQALNRLIEGGYVGDGAASFGNTDDDIEIAKRLGLIK